jgi:hypothetical protein
MKTVRRTGNYRNFSYRPSKINHNGLSYEEFTSLPETPPAHPPPTTSPSRSSQGRPQRTRSPPLHLLFAPSGKDDG